MDPNSQKHGSTCLLLIEPFRPILESFVPFLLSMVPVLSLDCTGKSDLGLQKQEREKQSGGQR